ncbi:MAG: hypothetical protein JWP87_3977 [Labilithrix sp.]|nr:hypothetical protein [Labilithrix sp.]
MIEVDGTPFRAAGWLEPVRLVRTMLVTTAIALAIASYGYSLALSAALIFASMNLRARPSSRSATWLALGGIVPYAIIAVLEGLLLSTHSLGDTWAQIQLAHHVTMLAGFPGAALAIVCAFATWRVTAVHREPSLDASSRVLLVTGGGLALGGTVAAFLHLTFRSLPATIALVAIGVTLLAVLVKNELACIAFLRRVYGKQDPSWSVAPYDAGDAGTAAALPPLRRRSAREQETSGVLQRVVASGGYRAADGSTRIARCPLDLALATDASWRRITWAALLVFVVAGVLGAVVAVPELLKFLR